MHNGFNTSCVIYRSRNRGKMSLVSVSPVLGIRKNFHPCPHSVCMFSYEGHDCQGMNAGWGQVANPGVSPFLQSCLTQLLLVSTVYSREAGLQALRYSLVPNLLNLHFN